VEPSRQGPARQAGPTLPKAFFAPAREEDFQLEELGQQQVKELGEHGI
jgi:hypothetical protein